MIQDRRRLRIYQIVTADGELSVDLGAECWQDDQGAVHGTGLWYDLIVPSSEDLEAQARAKNISALEWLRQKLSTITYIKIEVL